MERDRLRLPNASLNDETKTKIKEAARDLKIEIKR